MDNSALPNPPRIHSLPTVHLQADFIQIGLSYWRKLMPRIGACAPSLGLITDDCVPIAIVEPVLALGNKQTHPRAKCPLWPGVFRP